MKMLRRFLLVVALLLLLIPVSKVDHIAVATVHDWTLVAIVIWAWVCEYERGGS